MDILYKIFTVIEMMARYESGWEEVHKMQMTSNEDSMYISLYYLGTITVTL